MIIAALLAAAALDQAQAAFSQGDWAQAEAAALAVAQPPQAGAALNLAGLARFRAGKPAEALEALEAAGRAEDAPPAAPWHYNKAACLYQLERYAEAEAEYLQAASDASLAPLALVDAGYAALDGGSPERARALGAAAADLAADLESQLDQRAAKAYRSGLAAYDEGRYQQAREMFLRASGLDPAFGRSRIMAAASSWWLGRRIEARDELSRALSGHLEEADARAARDYLDALSPGLPARGSGLRGSLRLSAGFDSDPVQSGLSQPEDLPGTTAGGGSALSSAQADLAWRFRAGEKVFAELAYGFDQVAYVAPSAADRSLQLHSLSLSVEMAVRDWLRVGTSASGEMDFTGLGHFRGLQSSLRGGLWAAVDEGDLFSTRVDAGVARKYGIGNEFSYLTGTRTDVSAAEQLALGPVALDAGYAFRLDDIGTLAQRPGEVAPYGYSSHTFWIGARGGLGALSLEAAAGSEWRSYLAYAPGPPGPEQAGPSDHRWFASAAVGWRLTRGLAISLRYDLLSSRPEDDREFLCAPGEACGTPRASYDKHVVTLGTSISW